MQMVKSLFRWFAKNDKNMPVINRAHNEHKISLEKLIELLEHSGEAPRFLMELRREQERLEEQDFESHTW